MKGSNKDWDDVSIDTALATLERLAKKRRETTGSKSTPLMSEIEGEADVGRDGLHRRD